MKMALRYKHSRSVCFPRTNESLAGIVRGLDVGPDDRVLSICGSGDQPLAILEKAESVAAIDVDSEQMAYAMARVDLIRLGKFSLFRYPDIFTSCGFWGLIEALAYRETIVSRHFTPERLRNIQTRLHRLTACIGDIFEWHSHPDWIESKFDKVYLSNALDAQPFSGNASSIISLFPIVKQFGLIYVSDRFYVDLFAEAINTQLELDEGLTSVARRENADLINWNPGIYRKITK
jgi:hypothetical protein